MSRYHSRRGVAGFWTLLGVATVASIIFWMLVIPFWYGTWKDTDSVINRAQVAAEAEDMLGYMQDLKVNLEEHGMTDGYTAVIFKGPDNDLSLNYRAINRIIERLDGIKDMDKTGTTYQVALDDIRGTIRELPNPTDGYVWVAVWGWTLLVLLLWIVALISWFFSDYA